MNQKDLNTKYNLLVLMDLSKSSENALKNAVQLAKTIHGSIDVFHVKAPTDVVKSENQLSAIRGIHQESRSTKSKLEELIQKTIAEEGVKIGYQISYGNVKNTIQRHIEQRQPDIVILGKERPKLIGFLSDDLTGYLLNESNVNVLIVGEGNTLDSYKDISLGIYGTIQNKSSLEILDNLKQETSKRIKHFSVRDSNKETQKEEKGNTNATSYVFSEGANALDGLASYVLKTNTQILCIAKEPKGSKVTASVKPLLRKLDIPVLLLR
ncbi:universal stress protein [Flagellimonas sp. 389]|uniref:universal stress protein n=1 Tax=Flagellimonas sp. 389 TaxID=2835862 RepID=UPI001BD2AA0B|nr:universal stress protein [Flagellimonas sp. 389]MBS9463525.1 universal stress protein [Flagellimonas sp. 389]